jgi:hypothetical protein
MRFVKVNIHLGGFPPGIRQGLNNEADHTIIYKEEYPIRFSHIKNREEEK